MSRFRLFLLATAALVGSGSAARATIITTTTQTLNFGPQRTEFPGIAQAFNVFDSNLGTLKSITVATTFGFNSNITVRNSAASASTGNAQAEAALIMSAQSTNVNTVLQSLLNSPVDPAIFGGNTSVSQDVLGVKKTYSLQPNTATVLASNSTVHSSGAIVDSTAADLLPFEAAGGGATNVIANTFTQTNLANNGGNTTTSEVTTAQAGFSIFYTYDDSTATPPPPPPPPPPPSVPEPATLALIGVGLCGVGIARRRRR